MPGEKTSYSPQDLLGAWKHAHEEDDPKDSLRQVYRPGSGAFKPSRGREAFELREENRATFDEIAPADGSIPTEARWRLESGNLLVIEQPDGRVRRWQVEEAAPDRLVLREILDSP